MAAPLIIIHPDIADDPAFQNDVVLTTFTAAGFPNPVPAGTMMRLAAYESKTLSDIDASLSRKDAAVVLRHRVTRE